MPECIMCVKIWRCRVFGDLFEKCRATFPSTMKDFGIKRHQYMLEQTKNCELFVEDNR